MATTQLIEDLEYACHGGKRLRLDILQPEGPGPHPVLMYLHGGAFAVGSKRSQRCSCPPSAGVRQVTIARQARACGVLSE